MSSASFVRDNSLYVLIHSVGIGSIVCAKCWRSFLCLSQRLLTLTSNLSERQKRPDTEVRSLLKEQKLSFSNPSLTPMHAFGKFNECLHSLFVLKEGATGIAKFGAPQLRFEALPHSCASGGWVNFDILETDYGSLPSEDFTVDLLG